MIRIGATVFVGDFFHSGMSGVIVAQTAKACPKCGGALYCVHVREGDFANLKMSICESKLTEYRTQ